MQAVKIKGPCQRVGCERNSEALLFRIEGELFAADRERGVKAGYRLYCSECARGIMLAADRLAAADGRNV